MKDFCLKVGVSVGHSLYFDVSGYPLYQFGVECFNQEPPFAIRNYSTFQKSLLSMIQTTTQVPQVTLKAVGGGHMKIDGAETNYGDWRDDLARDGYAVVKGAIPRDRADAYADSMYAWLEGL